MNNFILHTDIQEYINDNLHADISKILFKGTNFPSVTTQEIVEQIEAKKKCKKKLPTWYNNKNIYFPNKLNIEQTSSEITANYKSNIVSGKSLIDLTGGFGVDCYYFSKKFDSITHCEINDNLSKIATHNYQKLGVKNCKFIVENGIDFLQKNEGKFDCIYIDPSRRNDVKGKVFLLEDCEPNLPKNLKLLFEKSNSILIKVSPILDIKSAINELKYVKEIHIVAVNNEVKELLLVLEENYNKIPITRTINIYNEKSQVFNYQFINSTTSTYSLTKNYLYEPNAAILKSGGFHEISKQFQINKLHKHSHLYTSDKLINFPGRRFQILYSISFDKKKLKKLIPSGKANITTRNFPQTVAQIRKKTGLKDGGNLYLFFTTNLDNRPIVLICEKIYIEI